MKHEVLQSLSLVFMTVAAFSVSAATNYWDANGDIAGFGTAAGTWGISTNWSGDATGETAPDVTDTTVADDLFLGTREHGLGAGTITVDSTNQAFRSLTIGSASGAITLGNGALKLAAPYSKVIINNGADTITSALTGSNGLFKVGTVSYGAFLTTNATVIVPNAQLSNFAGASGKLGGAAISRTNPLTCNVHHFVNNATNATYQLQYYDKPNTKCVKVELIQAGADIAGRVVYAKYISGVALGSDFDLIAATTYGIATSYVSTGYGVAETLLYLKAGVHEPFLPETPEVVVAFTNATLADFVGAAGNMGGARITGNSTPGQVYFFTNNGATATYQLQTYNGRYTKCVKIQLVQSGPDITACAISAKYYSTQDVNVLGIDFDTASGVLPGDVTTSHTGAGYGAAQTILISASDRAVLTLSGINTYTGATIAGNGTLEIASPGVLGGGTYAGQILTTGSLLYNSNMRQTLSGTISGTGSLVKSTPVIENVPIDQEGYVQTNATAYFTNAALKDYRSADGIMGGSHITSPPMAESFHYMFDGTKATCQFQAFDDVYIKCVKVEFTQVGADIAARGVYAKYISDDNKLGYDFDKGGNSTTIATSSSAVGYGISQITLNTTGSSKLTLAGINSYNGGTVVDAGVLEATTSADALPPAGGITVNANGELLLNVAGLNSTPSTTASSVGGSNPITVNGGKLTLAQFFNAGHNRLITINGGTLDSMFMNNDDNGNYINKVTLMNGARVIGYKLRIGYISTPIITVSGTSPSFLEAGMNLVKYGVVPLTLNVADVTGNDDADLLIPGTISDYYESILGGMPIVKTGAGTVSFSGVNTFTGTVTITEGTLALDGNSALNVTNNLILNGGALSIGAVTNACGTLTLSTNSVINLGEGALCFKDSSTVAWGNNAALELIGTLGPQTLRVGTNATALTPAQLAAISYNGQSVSLRSDGYLSPWRRGTVLIMR